MNTDIIERNAAKVLTLFSLSPGSNFSRKEIKEKTMLHNIPLDNAIAMLLHNDIMKKERRLLFLNNRNRYAKSVVKILKEEFERFKELPLKIYYLLVDVSYMVAGVRNIGQIYLFGSYAKLIHTQESDIDLAIILDKKKDRETADEVKGIVNKAEKKYGKTIECHFFEKSDLKKKDPLIKEILRNNVALFKEESKKVT